jgi:hypothetical protein
MLIIASMLVACTPAPTSDKAVRMEEPQSVSAPVPSDVAVRITEDQDGQTVDAVSPTITAIRAQLYYERTASFSENIVAPSRIALWNVIVGEGDAEHPSNSTLVTVEVRGVMSPSAR